MSSTKSRGQAKREAELDKPNADPNENPEQFFVRDPVHAVTPDYDKAADVAPSIPEIEPKPAPPAKGAKHKLTGVHTHVAVRVGQAEGRLIQVGEYVPAGLPIAHVEEDGSGHWMADAPKKSKTDDE